jgi:hypothetical protein
MEYKAHRSPLFLQSFDLLTSAEQKAIIQAISKLLQNPRHPSLQTHIVEPRSQKPKIFEAYASAELRITWQYSGNDEILLRNCGHHDKTLKKP